MPWTRQQVKYLLSKATPLSEKQQDKMKAELHADPSMGHAQKHKDVESSSYDWRKRGRPKR